MKKFTLPALIAGLLLPLAALAQTAPVPAPIAAPDRDLRFTLPKTVSREATAMLTPALAAQRAARPQRMAMALDFATLRATAEVGVDAKMAATAQAMGVTYTPGTLGAVPVLNVAAPGAAADGRVLIYVHGGGWIGGSVKSTFRSAAIFAVSTGLPVISVEYGLAPEHDFRDVTAQVVAVYRALLAKGYKASQIGMFGDSAGGNIILGTTLRLRDEGVPLPAALVALSPCTDLGSDGDTRTTLADADPVLDMPIWLDAVSHAYAGKDGAGFTHPWASPVLGDYSKPYPPTLIQGGTREILLSDFVREYQVIRMGGGEAVLDLYEGMPHVFMSLLPTTPEGKQAIATSRAFFLTRLAKN